MGGCFKLNTSAFTNEEAAKQAKQTYDNFWGFEKKDGCYSLKSDLTADGRKAAEAYLTAESDASGGKLPRLQSADCYYLNPGLLTDPKRLEEKNIAEGSLKFATADKKITGRAPLVVHEGDCYYSASPELAPILWEMQAKGSMFIREDAKATVDGTAAEAPRKKTFDDCEQLFTNITNAMEKIPGKIKQKIMGMPDNEIAQLNKRLNASGWGVLMTRETIAAEHLDLDEIYATLKSVDEGLAALLTEQVKYALDTILLSVKDDPNDKRNKYEKTIDYLTGVKKPEYGLDAKLTKLVNDPSVDQYKRNNIARLIKANLSAWGSAVTLENGGASTVAIDKNKAYQDNINAEKASEALSVVFPIVDEFFAKVTAKCVGGFLTANPTPLTFEEAQAIVGLSANNQVVDLTAKKGLAIDQSTFCCVEDTCPTYNSATNTWGTGVYKFSSVPGIVNGFQEKFDNPETSMTTIVDGDGKRTEVPIVTAISSDRLKAIAKFIKEDENVIQQQNIANNSSPLRTIGVAVGSTLLGILGTGLVFGYLQERNNKRGMSLVKEQGKLFANATLADFKLSDIEYPTLQEAQSEFDTTGKFSKPYFDERGDLVELTKIWQRTGAGAKYHSGVFGQSQSGKSAVIQNGLPQMLVLAKLSSAELAVYFETMKKNMSNSDAELYEKCTRRAIDNYNNGLNDPAVKAIGPKGFKLHPITWGAIKDPGGSMQDAANTAWGKIEKECLQDVKDGYIPLLIIEEVQSGENDKIIEAIMQRMKVAMTQLNDGPRVIMITTVKEMESIARDSALMNRLQPKMIYIPKPTTTNRFLKETKALANTGVTSLTDQAMEAIYLLGNETSAKAASVTCADEYLQNLASYAKDKGVTSIDFDFVMQFQRERYPGHLNDLKPSELAPMMKVMQMKLEESDRKTEARLNKIIEENADGDKSTIGAELKRMRETGISDATILLEEVGRVSYDFDAQVDKAVLAETLKAVSPDSFGKLSPKNQGIIVDLIENGWSNLPEEQKNMCVGRDAFNGVEIKSGRVPQTFVMAILQKMGIQTVEPAPAPVVAPAPAPAPVAAPAAPEPKGKYAGLIGKDYDPDKKITKKEAKDLDRGYRAVVTDPGATILMESTKIGSFDLAADPDAFARVWRTQNFIDIGWLVLLNRRFSSVDNIKGRVYININVPNVERFMAAFNAEVIEPNADKICQFKVHPELLRAHSRADSAVLYFESEVQTELLAAIEAFAIRHPEFAKDGIPTAAVQLYSRSGQKLDGYSFAEESISGSSPNDIVSQVLTEASAWASRQKNVTWADVEAKISELLIANGRDPHNPAFTKDLRSKWEAVREHSKVDFGKLGSASPKGAGGTSSSMQETTLGNVNPYLTPAMLDSIAAGMNEPGSPTYVKPMVAGDQVAVATMNPSPRDVRGALGRTANEVMGYTDAGVAHAAEFVKNGLLMAGGVALAEVGIAAATGDWAALKKKSLRQELTNIGVMTGSSSLTMAALTKAGVVQEMPWLGGHVVPLFAALVAVKIARGEKISIPGTCLEGANLMLASKIVRYILKAAGMRNAITGFRDNIKQLKVNPILFMAVTALDVGGTVLFSMGEQAGAQYLNKPDMKKRIAELIVDNNQLLARLEKGEDVTDALGLVQLALARAMHYIGEQANQETNWGATVLEPNSGYDILKDGGDWVKYYKKPVQNISVTSGGVDPYENIPMVGKKDVKLEAHGQNWRFAGEAQTVTHVEPLRVNSVKQSLSDDSAELYVQLVRYVQASNKEIE